MKDGLDLIGKRELRELLSKGWMTHDALWFMHCLNEFGIEKTNKMNMAAVMSMADFEIKRLKKALGRRDETITEFDQLAGFIVDAFGLIKADFMKFEMDLSEKNTLSWEWAEGGCFAHQGISALGCIDGYHCGILKRVEGWLMGLGVAYRMDPTVETCLLLKQDRCTGRFIFNLK